MPKYRKKPVVVEATQWLGWDKGPHNLGVMPYGDRPRFGIISTLEGDHIVKPGDFIITGIAGEKYPCKPDIFAATYDEVNDNA